MSDTRTTRPDALSTARGRTVLRVERHLPHLPEKVWRALTTPEHLAGWFPSTVEIDLRVGGRVVFDGGTTTGIVDALDPPRLLAFTWQTDHLRWEIRPAEGGSVLVLHHAFDDRAGAASFATGWSACLAGLRQLLAGEPVAPDVDMVADHERYVTLFDLDVPVINGDGIRLERQLTLPAEEAWWALRRATTAAVRTEEAPRLLEYESDGGLMRWELGEGTGHGARLVVTGTGPFTRPVADVAEELRRRVRDLAAR